MRMMRNRRLPVAALAVCAVGMPLGADFVTIGSSGGQVLLGVRSAGGEPFGVDASMDLELWNPMVWVRPGRGSEVTLVPDLQGPSSGSEALFFRLAESEPATLPDRWRAEWERRARVGHTFRLVRVCLCTPLVVEARVTLFDGLLSVAEVRIDGAPVEGNPVEVPGMDGLWSELESRLADPGAEVLLRADPRTGVIAYLRVRTESETVVWQVSGFQWIGGPG